MTSSRMLQRLSTPFRRAEEPHVDEPDRVVPLLQRPDRAVVRERRSPVWERHLVRRVLALDLVAAVVAAVTALLAVVSGFGADEAVRYEVLAAAFPVVWLLACASTRSYEPRFLGTGSEEFRRVSDAGVRLLALTALVLYSTKQDPARRFILIIFPLAVVLTLVLRYLSRQRLHKQRAAGLHMHQVLVVGRERSCAELIRQLHREPYAGFKVIGACADYAQTATIEGVPVVGKSATILEALERTGADTVAVGAWSDLNQADLRQLSWDLEGSGVDLVVAPSLTDIAGPRIHIRPVAGLPLLHVEEPEFTGGRRLLKGTFDRLSSLTAVLLLLPLLLGLALAVRLTSSGPAFFKQRRVGADGKPFTMLKFRSMYVDAEERLADLKDKNENSDGLLFKMRDDPRVTKVGKYLRRFSLDELPQLLNVVKGDMSLIGPRPPLPREVVQYGADVRRRLLVKPGLTGLWQVSGRSDLSWDESVRLDLHYVENWSLALDLMILWKTANAVLGKRGAY